MINELKTAISNRVNVGDNPLKTALGGRFFYEAVPPKTPYPYAVFSDVTSTPKRDTVNRFEDPVFQISIFDKNTDSERIGNIEQYVIDRFDDCEGSLVLASYHVIEIRRNYNKSIPTLDGEVKHTVLQYSLKLQRK